MKHLPRSFAAIKTLLICVLLTLASACAVYKPELSQGNLLTAEQISKLQLGMPRAQVQLLLGSPLLQDVFHANRWEYIFRQIKGEKTLEQRVFTVEFDAGGKLVKWTDMGRSDARSIQLSNPLSAPVPTASALPTSPTIASAPPELPLVIASGLNQSTQRAPQEAAPSIASPNTPALMSVAADISNALESWRADWQKANFAGYISHYRADFIGASRNRAAWEVDRKRMISGRKIVSITLSELSVQQTSDRAARAYFKQRFEAVNFQENGEKTLLLERINGRWLITSETFNKA